MEKEGKETKMNIGDSEGRGQREGEKTFVNVNTKINPFKNFFPYSKKIYKDILLPRTLPFGN